MNRTPYFIMLDSGVLLNTEEILSIEPFNLVEEGHYAYTIMCKLKNNKTLKIRTFKDADESIKFLKKLHKRINRWWYWREV